MAISSNIRKAVYILIVVCIFIQFTLYMTEIKNSNAGIRKNNNHILTEPKNFKPLRQADRALNRSLVNDFRIHFQKGVAFTDITNKTQELPVIAWLNPLRSRRKNLDAHVRLDQCPNYRCRLKYVRVPNEQNFTWDENIRWNAIIFQGNRIPKMVLPRRQEHQAFVFFNTEPPPYIHWPRYRDPTWNGVFNWTMTYRLDSDIPIPFGRINKRVIPILKNYREIFRLKTKLTAWVVSHCGADSKREKYVDILKKFTNVDVYGTCGNLHNCSRRNDNLCRKTIEQDYKFYLGFENNFCKDYATEKIYRMFDRNIIVVVRGGANYSQILPKGTYIDTSKFKTISALGAYLNELGSDEEKYIEYLRQKDQYWNERPFQKPYCDLCDRLHNLEKYRHSYASIGKWWLSNTCLNRKEIKDVIS